MPRVPITVPAASVGATLTGFPVYLDLSTLPAGFWSGLAHDDGRDIRVKDGSGNDLPFDLVWIDRVAQTGSLFTKVTLSSASDTTIYVHFGDAGLSAPAPSDPNGRHAVWTDFEAVFLFGETLVSDRTGGPDATIGGVPDFFDLVETSSTDLNSHQGVCFDGTHYYTTDTNAIHKWDTGWNLIASNTNPIAATGLSGALGLNHCGDPDVKDGRLYVPIERWPLSGGQYNAHIAVFDPSDLSFIEAFDISTANHEAASVAYCDDDDLLYVVDFDGNDSTIYKYDPTDGSARGTLTTSRAITSRQGITWWKGYFWISGDSSNGATYRVATDGTVLGPVGLGEAAAAYEGIGHTDEELLQLKDAGVVERVEVFRFRHSVNAGVRSRGSSGTFVMGSGRQSFQTYTLACTAAIANKSSNRVAVSYWDESAGIVNTRQVIAYRFATGTLALWDANNTWLEPSPAVDPTLDQAYRIHAVYNGTTSRSIYIDGTLRNTQTNITAVPSALDTIRVLSEDASNVELWQGTVGYVYLYPGVLSDEWIAAEYANLNDPASFYSVGALDAGGVERVQYFIF